MRKLHEEPPITNQLPFDRRLPVQQGNSASKLL
jgi:hypothetical protein